MTTLSGICSSTTDTSKSEYKKSYIRALIADVEMGKIYKYEMLRYDSLTTLYQSYAANRDSIIDAMTTTDLGKDTIINSLVIVTKDLKKQQEYTLAWVKGINTELRRQKVKTFFNRVLNVLVIGTGIYLFVKK